MKSLFFLLTALCSAVLLQAQHHDAAATAKITTNPLLQQLVNESGIDNKKVIMEIVNFPPLNVGKAHRHPCPLFAYVLEGELESTFEGKTYQYKQGDAFYEFKNGLHDSTRNPDSTKVAKLLVFYIADKEGVTYLPEKH